MALMLTTKCPRMARVAELTSKAGQDALPRVTTCRCGRTRPGSRLRVLTSPLANSSARPGVARQPLKSTSDQRTVRCASGEGSGASTGLEERELKPSDPGLQWDSALLPFLFPALGGLLFGYDIGATSGAVVLLKDSVLCGVAWAPLSATATGLLVSASLVGALLGCAATFAIAEPLGPRRELMLAAVCYGLGAALMGVAPAYEALLAGRVLYGLGIGLAMHAAPLYIAETTPAEVRGTLISLKEAFIVGGILLGYAAGSAEVDVVGGWRFIYAAAAPLAAVMFAGMSLLPPSPRWLLLQASKSPIAAEAAALRSQAVSALQRLRGRHVTAEEVEREVADTCGLLAASKDAADATGGGLQALLERPVRRPLAIGGGLVLFQQITGQPSVLYYAASILQEAGFSAAADASRVAVVLGLFKLAMTGVAVGVVDQWGRRPLLQAGVAGMVLALTCLAGVSLADSQAPLLSAAALLLYVGSYQVSFGPISWLMVSEVFPLRVRARAGGLTTLVNFGANAVVVLLLPTVQESLGQGGTFFLFAMIGIGALAFVYTVVPETKGLTLEQIEARLSQD